MTASTVIVVGEGKIVTWDLPAGDRVFNARANIRDSVHTIVLDDLPLNFKRSPTSRASISPDFDYFVTTATQHSLSLNLYDMFTGKCVWATSESGFRSGFTRDGREVWSSTVDMSVRGWKVIKGGKSNVIRLEPLERNAEPSGGYPWESSHGHDVTDDGWILDSRKKRVMWLPHRWRTYEEMHRIWNGRFLGLLDPRLPEPVILELDE